MKLTKLQRYTAYCIMLVEAEEIIKYPGVWGLCLMVYQRFGLDDKVSEFTSSLKFFPELLKKEPKKYFRFWFSQNKAGWEKRIELLKQCIIETHP